MKNFGITKEDLIDFAKKNKRDPIQKLDLDDDQANVFANPTFDEINLMYNRNKNSN